MILVPTRELALQTAHVLKDLGKFLNLQIMTSTGGTDLKDDVMRLSKVVHIIVATPGRIHDLGQKGIAKLSQCSHLVMDEVRPDTALSPIASCVLCHIIMSCDSAVIVAVADRCLPFIHCGLRLQAPAPLQASAQLFQQHV